MKINVSDSLLPSFLPPSPLLLPPLTPPCLFSPSLSPPPHPLPPPDLAQNTFSICTKYRGVLLQAKEKEVQEWIYAMDPLLAGSLK